MIGFVRRHVVVTAALVFLVAVAISGAVLRPHGPSLLLPGRGDPALVRQLADSLDHADRHRIAAAVISGASVRHALFGADMQTTFAVGSITKAFTGQLFADAIARREVRPDSTVGQFIQVGDAPIGSVRLSELATYRSGLGEWGDDQRDSGLSRWWSRSVRGMNTREASTDELIDRARHDQLSTRGSFQYSNAGVALLAESISRAAGVSFSMLAQSRLFGPLGMTRTFIPTGPVSNLETGFTPDGRRAPSWSLGAYAPSGGAWSTIADMTRFGQALLDRRGLTTALDPQRIDGVETGTGYGWMLSVREGRSVDFKSGQVGGYAGSMIVDRASGTVVIILSDTAEPVIDAAWDVWKVNTR